jgi:hypothetical protein
LSHWLSFLADAKLLIFVGSGSGMRADTSGVRAVVRNYFRAL